MSRNLLHILKFDEFVAWLDANSIAHRPGKGDYQKLQVQTPDNGWQVIFIRLDMKEHFSTNVKLDKLIRDFTGRA
jgi:hypothetical protein